MIKSPSRPCVDCGGTAPNVEFYESAPHRCKGCTKARVRAWYDRTRPERSAYEALRAKDPTRKAKVLEYQKERRAREPQKNAARVAVGNALRDGRLVRKPCEACGSEKSQAHHDDYSKPLDVRWFCFKHHREIGHGQTVTAA